MSEQCKLLKEKVNVLTFEDAIKSLSPDTVHLLRFLMLEKKNNSEETDYAIQFSFNADEFMCYLENFTRPALNGYDTLSRCIVEMICIVLKSNPEDEAHQSFFVQPLIHGSSIKATGETEIKMGKDIYDYLTEKFKTVTYSNEA